MSTHLNLHVVHNSGRALPSWDFSSTIYLISCRWTCELHATVTKIVWIWLLWLGLLWGYTMIFFMSYWQFHGCFMSLVNLVDHITNSIITIYIVLFFLLKYLCTCIMHCFLKLIKSDVVMFSLNSVNISILFCYL